MNRWDGQRQVLSDFGGTGKTKRTPLQEDYRPDDDDGSAFEGLLPAREQEALRERTD